MIYVSCPECGHKLLEGEEGSRVQVKCNKCGRIVQADLSEREVRVTVFKKKVSNENIGVEANHL